MTLARNQTAASPVTSDPSCHDEEVDVVEVMTGKGDVEEGREDVEEEEKQIEDAGM